MHSTPETVSQPLPRRHQRSMSGVRLLPSAFRKTTPIPTTASTQRGHWKETVSTNSLLSTTHPCNNTYQCGGKRLYVQTEDGQATFPTRIEVMSLIYHIAHIMPNQVRFHQALACAFMGNSDREMPVTILHRAFTSGFILKFSSPA